MTTKLARHKGVPAKSVYEPRLKDLGSSMTRAGWLPAGVEFHAYASYLVENHGISCPPSQREHAYGITPS